MLLHGVDLAKPALSAAFVLASYLTFRCWSPPNLCPISPTATLPKDKVAPKTGHIQGRRFITLFLWTLHITLAASYPSPPTAICPNRANLSASLFTWSPYTIAVLTAIVICAPIRLLAFGELQENFTFRLAKPTRLVTTGPYAYVQHPSYPTNWIILAANIALLLRLDGALGCILPGWLVQLGMGTRGFGVWPMLLVLFAAAGLVSIWIRVQDEEAMLKKEMGRDWEEYHQRTKRFIPGLF